MDLNERLSLLLQTLTGDPHVHAYPYQQRCAEHLLSGDNLVLSAPTGSGKTWATILPFLLSLSDGHPIADRLIYTLPLRSLASSLHQSTKEALERYYSSTSVMGKLPRRLNVTLQTGASKDDPFFEGDIVFATIDQLLSSYLNAPVSLPGKLGNINAGALVGAVIVLDEVHLLDPQRSMRTASEMTRRLSGLSQFVWQTATMSRGGIAELQRILKAAVVEVPDHELAQMPSQRDKQRCYQWNKEPLTAEHVISAHRSRSIVICNSVGHAQEIHADLARAIAEHRFGESAPTLFLLHNRFFTQHRRQIEQQLASYFGPDAIDDNAILVATQVIEAGIDISADQLHTELAPMNSLIQRAGRCARYAGERGKGAVNCYALPTNPAGNRRLGPYRDQVGIVDVTERVWCEYQGAMLSFADEQRMINEVYGQSEQQTLRVIGRGLSELRREISTIQIAHAGRRSADVMDLIRDVDSVNIWLTDHPESWDPSQPMEYLSLPRVSLLSLVPMLDQRQGWAAKILVEVGEDDASIRWEVAQSPKDLLAAGWLIALHPSVAHYTPTSGLVLGVGGPLFPHPVKERVTVPGYSYRCETWRQHALTVQSIAERMAREKHAIGCQRVCTRLGISDYRALVIPALLHDVGKLTAWQEPIKRWQQTVDPDNSAYQTGEPLAHSTFDWTVHRGGEQQRQFRRPPHAVEGAFAVLPILEALAARLVDDPSDTDELVRCMLTAIARHHHAGAKHLECYHLIPEADRVIQMVLQDWDLPPQARLRDAPSLDHIMRFPGALLTGDQDRWFPLYWLMVRILRLADQQSQAEKR